MAQQFNHLRIHTEYSIEDGLVRIDDLVKSAATDRQAAIAVTDLGNFFGLVKFYRAARSKGVKPIAACDVWISNEEKPDRPSRLLLFAKNKTGYLQLCELLSRAWLENQVKGRAEIKTEWLSALSGNALIALSGAHAGDIGTAIDAENMALAEKHATKWARIFPDSFYIEIQRYGQPNMEPHIVSAVQLAEKMNLPVVATHPVQFLSANEFTAHEARVCIAEQSLLSDANRVRRFYDRQYFLSQSEMVELFSDLPDALENSCEIAKRCNLELDLGRPRLPNFPTPEGVTIEEFLEHEAKAGLEKRLEQLFPDAGTRERERGRYDARLKFETDTIIKMGFPGYFLIVAEFINWAKNNGVPVGPGRGSGAGSLVAYSLLITDLDPLAYNLLFERFLNPERVSMPDFDIDFCQHGRDRVIQHVKDLYGKEAVSQIATFGTMAAKGAVRDVGRVLNLGYNFCDGISKLIPQQPGKHVTIADALVAEPALASRYESEDEVRELIDLAQQVEGISRNIGMHAGGVLIAPGKLTDFCPLFTQSGETGVVSQFDKDDVEAAGLVKFDFLGLTTLTILDLAVRYIKQLDPALRDFRLDTLPMTDAPTYKLLMEGRTVAVFQLESKGMQGMLKDAKPDRFEDVIALVALYRPGPMDLIPDFCRRKHGEAFQYPDPRTEGILSETYGIMVYQEQVMQMAQVIGGYSLGGADLLRRAMGKKKPEEMAKHRQIFQDGASKNGLTNDKADEIFDLMEKFAGYGFNKSHAAAYALLSYHTAYLKTHHPAAFMAANMSLAMADTDKVKIIVDDAVEVCGLTILPPDINESEYFFVPVGTPGQPARQIRYGLGGIKGTGEHAIEAIVSARRKGGPFTSLFDFAKRVDKQATNRRTIESLIRAGAFDCMGVDRATLLASVSVAIEGATQAKAAANQGSLFGDDDFGVDGGQQYAKVEPWTEKRKLAEEKAALGYYLSGHLFALYEKEFQRFGRVRLRDLRPSRDSKMIAGVISATRTQMTNRGKMMIVTLDDASATVDVTIYNEVYMANKSILQSDEFLAVVGRISEDRFSGGVRVSADKVLNLAATRAQLARKYVIPLADGITAEMLKEVITPFRSPRGLPLALERQRNGASYEILLSEEWKVLPEDDLKRALLDKLQVQCPRIEY